MSITYAEGKHPRGGARVILGSGNSDIEGCYVSEKWAETFEFIEQCYSDGIPWKASDWFKSLPSRERRQFSFSKIYPLRRFCLVYLLGPLWYLFKGMWLKTIVYISAFIGLNCLIALVFPDLDDSFYRHVGAGLNAVWAMMAPFDYYRLKRLEKQW